MSRTVRLVFALVLVAVMLFSASCARPTAVPTLTGEPATPTPDPMVQFTADAKAADAALTAALTLSQDFCKSVESTWYDAIADGKDGLVAAKDFVAADAQKTKIASFQTSMDTVGALVAAWKSATVPDAAKDIPAKVEEVVAAVQAMKTFMTDPSGTMETYQVAYTAAFDAAKAKYDALAAMVAALK